MPNVPIIGIFFLMRYREKEKVMCHIFVTFGLLKIICAL